MAHVQDRRLSLPGGCSGQAPPDRLHRREALPGPLPRPRWHRALGELRSRAGRHAVRLWCRHRPGEGQLGRSPPWPDHDVRVGRDSRPRPHRLPTLARDNSYVKNHIIPQFGSVPLAAMGYMLIQRWVADLSGKYAPSTVHKIQQLLNRYLREAVRAGRLASNPLPPRSVFRRS